MRVRSDTEALDVAPGTEADITVDVINTGQVIDGITARVLGFPDQHVRSHPEVLPLFPDSSGQLVLTLGLPRSFPAGRHPMTVEVSSRQSDTPPAYLDVDLLVPAVPALALTAQPQVVRAIRSGRFVVTATNRGNVPLDVAFSATDPERAVAVVLQPQRLLLPAGGAADIVVSLRGPRMILGSDLDRMVTVEGLVAAPTAPVDPTIKPLPGEPFPVDPFIPESLPVEQEHPAAAVPLRAEATLTLRQRPWFTRGMLTALILLAIIALWAAVFLFGIRQVFGGDALTKTAPASFFATAAAPAAGGASGGAAGAAGGTGGTSGTGGGASGTGAGSAVAGAPPAGALPKTGALPAGLGGTLSGTVTAASDGEPVGRILVEALRTNASGRIVVVGSAATQADGTYQVAGLFPGSYQVRFSANGFKGVTDGIHKVVSDQITTDVNAVITGLPATLSGSIDPGDTLEQVTSTVTVRPLTGPKTGKVVATAKTAANGTYQIPKLPAPGQYQISFTTTGYQASTVSATVTGGATRIVPSVLLSAGSGSISGTVTDGTSPIGQVTVSTTVNGAAVTTGTPTSGAIGTFTLGTLPTPATYVIVFTAPGFGQNTVVVDLGPGQSVGDLKVALAKGTTSVTGRLIDSAGAGIGGATVTVGGTANPPTTTTLTAGNIGGFSLDGLPSPGTYTLTFSHPGYADTTVPVQLTGTGAAAPLTVTMPGALGRISGVVTDSSGVPIVGSAVVATDGVKTWPVMSTAASGAVPAGGYVIDSLPAGVYTVTATNEAGTSRTSVVTVTAGKGVTINFSLPGAG